MSDKNNSLPLEDDDIVIDDSIEIEELPEEEPTAHHVPKKLIIAVATVVALLLALGLATYALSRSVEVSVKDNSFTTGSIGVNLNDGDPVITPEEFRFEPGMTVKKNFFIENPKEDESGAIVGSGDVYYKIYLDEVEGDLADVLIITVAHGEDTLYKGTASNFTQGNAKVADDVLKLDQRHNLTITFYYPKEAGNDTQNDTLSFRLMAVAVQTKNNDEKAFG